MTEAISIGGRSGSIQTPDGLLDVALGNPLEKGIEIRGPNPDDADHKQENQDRDDFCRSLCFSY